MLCPECHTENRDNAKFCDECGFDLRALAQATENTEEAPVVDLLRDADDVSVDVAEAAAEAIEPGGDQVDSACLIAEALEEVRSLRDTVPPMIDIPEIVDVPRVMDEAASTFTEPADEASAHASRTVDLPQVGACVLPDEPAALQDVSAEVTADLSGLERMIDSSYVPPKFSGRAGDTMELPRIDDSVAPASVAFVAAPDKKELRRQKKAQRKFERDQAKREEELKRQGTVAAMDAATPSAPSKPAPDVSKAPDLTRDADPADASQKTRSKKKPAVIGGVIAVVVLAAAIAGATYAMELWGGKVVPDIAGMSQVDASATLSAKGFETKTVQVKSDESEGLALSSDPAAGNRADAGSTITINVATSRVVPDIVGDTRADAVKLIEAEGLTNVEYVQVKSNEPEGSVLSVSPEAGERVKQNTAVVVEVAQSYVVPDIANKTTEEAKAALEAEGYVVKTAWYNTEEIPEGTAVSTNPAAGSKLASGSEVTLNIAHNRSTELVSMTTSFFTDSPRIQINGSNYEISTVNSVSYIGDNTCTFSVVARPYETHTWMFGIGSETRYGNYETITGSISWDDDNNIVATTPTMKQGA